jgi:hypothetical protein
MVGSAALAAALAAPAGWWARGPGEPVSAVPTAVPVRARPSAPIDAEPCPPVPVAKASAEELARSERLADLEREERELLGEPTSVSDAPPELRPGPAEAALRRVLEAFPGTEVVELRCEEVPCVAILRDPEVSPGDREEVPRAVSAAFGGGGWLASYPEGAATYAVALGPTATDVFEYRRTWIRVDEALTREGE